MAARTSSKKKAAKKRTAKKQAARKAPAKKKAAKKAPAARATAKKTAARKAAPRQAVRTETARGRTAAGKPAAPARKTGGVSSEGVHLGHVFALRPRVPTSFRQADFLKARSLLSGESFASVEEAARAVVEKALDLTHEGGGPGRGGARRRH